MMPNCAPDRTLRREFLIGRDCRFIDLNHHDDKDTSNENSMARAGS